MSNPLYNGFVAQNPFSEIIDQAKELKKRFNGNPREEVQRLLNSGQMSQQQFNQLSQMAQQILNSFTP